MRSLEQDRFLGARWVLAVGVLLLSAWLLWFFFSEIRLYEVANRARIEVADSSHAVGAEVSGRVLAIHMTLGAVVRQNDVLVELDAGSEELQLEEERSRVSAFSGEAAELSEQIAAERVALERQDDAAMARIVEAEQQHGPGLLRRRHDLDGDIGQNRERAVGAGQQFAHVVAGDILDHPATGLDRLAAPGDRLDAKEVIARRAGRAEFTDQFVQGADMQDMQGRVTCTLDAGIESQGMDVIRSRVEVGLKSGRTLVGEADQRYRGGPDKPMTDDDLEQKNAACVAGILDSARMSALIEAARGVVELDDAGVLARAIQTG